MSRGKQSTPESRQRFAKNMERVTSGKTVAEMDAEKDEGFFPTLELAQADAEARSAKNRAFYTVRQSTNRSAKRCFRVAAGWKWSATGERVVASVGHQYLGAFG